MRPILALLDLPPVWLAAHVVAAWVLSLISPRLFGSLGDWLGTLLVGLGLLVMLGAAAQMALARTTVIPRRAVAENGSETVLSPADLSRLVGEHEAILIAIQDGDEEAARSAMRNHLKSSQMRYRAMLRAPR